MEKYLSTANSELFATLSDRGFQASDSDSRLFVRRRASVVDCVLPEIVADGLFLIVRVFSWIPQFEDEWTAKDGATLPGIPRALNGGLLGVDGLGRGQQSWLVAVRSRREELLRGLRSAFEEVAEPFFRSIGTSEDAIAAIHPDYRGTTLFDRIRNRVR